MCRFGLALAIGYISVPRTTCATDPETSKISPSSKEIRIAIPTPTELSIAQTESVRAWESLSQKLSATATGVVLRKKLRLSELEDILRQPSWDGKWQEVETHERALWHFVPGTLQAEVDRFRSLFQRLIRLRKLAAKSPPDVERLLSPLLNFASRKTSSISQAEEEEIRDLYRLVSSLLPEEGDIHYLHERLSRPNSYMFVNRELVLRDAQRTFTVPVRYATQQQGASLSMHGEFSARISFQLPYSNESIVVRGCVDGQGCVSVNGDRKHLHAQTAIYPTVLASQTSRLGDYGIRSESPQVYVDLRAQKADVRFDGLLGKLGLFERLTGRLIDRLISEHQSKIADQLQTAIRTRADDEIQDITFRIQSLLKNRVWDRVESLGFQPKVEFISNIDGIHCRTDYSRLNQLGALVSAPPPPSDYPPHFDSMLCLHESTVNNLMDLFQGTRVDELTLRSLVEGQFKMTSQDWQNTPAGRIPSAITLSNSEFPQLRLLDNTIEVVLPLQACELDDQEPEQADCKILVRYKLDRRSDHPRLLRTHREFLGTSSSLNARTWTAVIDQMLPTSLEPLQRISRGTEKPSSTRHYLRIMDGWLFHGIGSDDSVARSGK